MTMFLNPRFIIGIAIALALAFSHGFVYKSGRAAVRAQWDADRLAQSEATRNREKAMTLANTGVDREHQIQKARLVAEQRVTDRRLRDLQATLEPRRDTAATGRTDDPRDSIIDRCSSALAGMDERAKSLESLAKSLQRYANEVCVTSKKNGNEGPQTR